MSTPTTAKSLHELLEHRLSLIRALYIVSVAASGPQDAIADEFRHAVGDVLMGMALPKLQLAHIRTDAVKEELAWLREPR